MRVAGAQDACGGQRGVQEGPKARSCRLRSDPADIGSPRETRPCVRAGPATAIENLHSVLKVGKLGELILPDK
jgi:hypothetical protein